MSGSDFIAYLIVGAAAFAILRYLYRHFLAAALSHLFLKRGKIGLAMKVRKQVDGGCDDCH